MCGITGILNLSSRQPVAEESLRQMLALIRHRGPDQFGIYLDDQVGLGSARLSIIDLSSGQQPISNEDETLWIVFNGEIFNYIELRQELMERGHQFSTQSDTEVIVHLYEEQGPACLDQLNGQFAIAIWDTRQQSLFLARDHVGICPLYYTISAGRLVFASEIKAILADPNTHAEIDPACLQEVFTFWSTLSPNTVFKDILQLNPGEYILCQDGKLTHHTYWKLDYPPAGVEKGSFQSLDESLEMLRELLIDATRIRLRADVPVGTYLSGGLDSSTISAIINNFTDNRQDTFSITFNDAAFDESAYQQKMADFLGTRHNVIHISHALIGKVFPKVIWHSETPIMRTSPAPMYLLSRLVHDHQFKVIVAGEGADEFLAGYDLFKEDRIRRFWAKEPNSQKRPLLLDRLYPDIQHLSHTSRAFLASFFRQGLLDTASPYYSHMLRWHNTSRTRRFFSVEMMQFNPNWEQWLESHSPYYPPDFMHWDPLHRAQYLEISIFFSQFLISVQGDHMVLANAVEGRYPFLDPRIIAFCNQLPPNFKLRGLTEKYLLKRLASQWIPPEIWRRPKRPYSAPNQPCFFPKNDPEPDYVEELLSPTQIKATGYFNPEAVARLVAKVRGGMNLGETDSMALSGIISTQLTHRLFVSDFSKPRQLGKKTDMKICSGEKVRSVV